MLTSQPRFLYKLILFRFESGQIQRDSHCLTNISNSEDWGQRGSMKKNTFIIEKSHWQKNNNTQLRFEGFLISLPSPRPHGLSMINMWESLPDNRSSSTINLSTYWLSNCGAVRRSERPRPAERGSHRNC